MEIIKTPNIQATCIRCTYDLRGLSAVGMCPECGYPIHLSREAGGSGVEEVAAADTGWRNKVKVGVFLPVIATGVLFFGAVMAQIVTGYTNPFRLLTYSTRDAALAAADVVAHIGCLAGAWLVTTPEPGTSSGDPVVRRWLLRIAALVTLLPAIAPTVPAGGRQAMLPLIVIATFIAEPVATYLFFTYLAPIAERLPVRQRGWLAGECRILARVMAILVFGVAMTTAIRDRSGGGSFPVMIIGDPVAATKGMLGLSRLNWRLGAESLLFLPAIWGMSVLWRIARRI